MSLERQVKRFAERRRQILRDRLRQLNNDDTKKVQWNGYDDDGHPQVKNNDKLESVDGLGLIGNKPNTSLILDTAGSVEYRNPVSSEAARYKIKPYVAPAAPVPKAKKSLIIDQTAADIRLNFLTREDDEDEEDEDPYDPPPPGPDPNPPNPVPPEPDAVSGVTSVSIIDENDNNDYTNNWQTFRNRFPSRPFHLIVPQTGNQNALNIPADLSGDSNASVSTMTTSATGADSIYRRIGLNNAPSGQRIVLWVDNSGSMTTYTIRGSYLRFRARAIERGDYVYCMIGISEQYILPHNVSDLALFPVGFKSNWNVLDQTIGY